MTTHDQNSPLYTALLEWRAIAESKNHRGPLPTDEDLLVFANTEGRERPGATNAWNRPLTLVLRAAQMEQWENVRAQLRKDGLPADYFIPHAEKLYQLRFQKQNPAPPRASEPVAPPAAAASPAPATQPAQPAQPTQPAQPAQSAAAAAPAAAPADVAPAPSTPERSASLRDYDEEDFAGLDEFEFEGPMGEELVFADFEDEGIRVEWQLPEDHTTSGKVQLYRVVVLEEEDEDAPLNPEEGYQRAVTVDTEWTDPEPLINALRIYQVWMHEGRDERRALRAQPKFVGEYRVFQHIPAIDLSWDGSVIRGMWPEAKGTDHVDVHIVVKGGGKINKVDNRKCEDTPNYRGFEWKPEALGNTYQVAAKRYVRSGGSSIGTRWSPVAEIAIPAKVVDVDVDVFEVEGTRDRFHVQWQNPHSGDVRIYRTKEPPADGLEDQDLSLSQLEANGLEESDHANRISQGEDSCIVEWPEDWYSLYITPVSIVGNQCRVGKSHVRVRVGRITHEKLYERVNNQLLTFGWPQAAHEVTAFAVAPGQGHTLGEDPADSQATFIGAVSEEDYRSQGGMRLTLSGPVDVVLYPSRRYQGEIIWGAPCVVPYRGLQKFRYSILDARDSSWGCLLVRIDAEREDFTGHQFSLRYCQKRLPLSSSDGEAVATRQWTQGVETPEEPSSSIIAERLHPAGADADSLWLIDPSVLSRGEGFLRLFILDEPGNHAPLFALLDPPLRTLDIGFHTEGQAL